VKIDVALVSSVGFSSPVHYAALTHHVSRIIILSIVPHLLRSNMPNQDSFPSTYQPPEISRLGYFYDRPGTIPGQLHLSDDAPPADLVLIDYDRDRATRVSITDPKQIKEHLQTHTVSWIDVLGLGNTATWDF
jgi:magnesium transporter